MTAHKYISTYSDRDGKFEAKNVHIGSWTSIGPKDNTDVLLAEEISLNGIIHSIFAIRVFDPELLGECPKGTMTWDHYEEYGPLLWNVDHGHQYINHILQPENPVEREIPYLKTKEFSLLEDCLDATIGCFISDHALTPPRIIINGQAYLLGLVPTSLGLNRTAENIILTENDWLRYGKYPDGYKETLIRIDDHLLKVKAFEVLIRTKKTGQDSFYGTGDDIVCNWLEEHQRSLNLLTKLTKVPHSRISPTQIESNYLLFGLSAVEAEERSKYETYREIEEIRSILPHGIVEYRFDEGMRDLQEWPSLIEMISEDLKRNENIDGNNYTLSLQDIKKITDPLPDRIDNFLDSTTQHSFNAFARWFIKNSDGEIVTDPEGFSLCLEWTRTSTGYRTSLTDNQIELLKNMEKGAATRFFENNDPLRIPTGSAL